MDRPIRNLAHMPNGFLIDGHVHCLSMSDEEDRTRTCLIDGHAQVLVMHLNFWDAHMRDGFLIDGHDRPSPQEEPRSIEVQAYSCRP